MLTILQNDHEWGDQWNGEDLSIYSVDDKPLPISPIPLSPDLSQSSSSLLQPATASNRRDVSGEANVTPATLKQALSNPSISSESARPSPELTLAPGYRAAEAFVRPAPVSVAGTVTHYGFDLKKCEFTLKIAAPAPAADDRPTVVFLPDFHYPKDVCVVDVTSGKWEIGAGDDEGAIVQRLRWWHGAGEQSLVITGLARKHNLIEGAAGEEIGYYEQCSQGASNNCGIM